MRKLPQLKRNKMKRLYYWLTQFNDSSGRWPLHCWCSPPPRQCHSSEHSSTSLHQPQPRWGSHHRMIRRCRVLQDQVLVLSSHIPPPVSSPPPRSQSSPWQQQGSYEGFIITCHVSPVVFPVTCQWLRTVSSLAVENSTKILTNIGTNHPNSGQWLQKQRRIILIY